MKKFIKLSRMAKTAANDPKRVFLETGVLDDEVGRKVARRIMLKRYLHNCLIGRKYA